MIVQRPLYWAALLALNSTLAIAQQTDQQQQQQQPVLTAEEKAELHEQSIDEGKRALMPLTPDEISSMVKMLDDRRKEAESGRGVPEAGAVSIPVSFSPGVKPPQIKVSAGYATAVLVQDVTGQPWPILSATIGDGDLFSAIKPDDPSHVVIITPKSRFSNSNLVLLLKGASTPVTLQLSTDPDVSMYRVALMVDSIGPNASIASISAPKPVADNTMRALLDGLTPEGVSQVALEGGPAAAFRSGNRLFIRTALSIERPAQIASITSGGITVYELPMTPVITASNAGRPVKLTVADEAILDYALSRTRPAAFDRFPVGSASN